jgi:LPXTG-site transpeptidase (sortase) family protein
VDNQPASPPETAAQATPQATATTIDTTVTPEPEPSATATTIETTATATTANEQSTTANVQSFLPEIPEGTSLFIPSAGIYAPVVQAYLDGTSWDVTRLGENVGHLQGTSWIDGPGNVVLSGHVELADGRQGVFSNLDELQINDIIVVVTGENERRYVITQIDSTTPDDLGPIKPTVEDRLTLITCGNYDFFQDAYLERLIVVAEPI